MNNRARGVTLIELLIAVSLLGILSTGMLMALRVGLNALDKTNTKLMANRRSMSVTQILRSQIGGFMPVGADCFPSPGQPPVKIAFFEGRDQSMRLVSSYSLEEAARGLPRVLEFQVIPGEENRGVRLVVNEYEYTGPRNTGSTCVGFAVVPETGVRLPRFAPIAAGPRSFVLADKLAFCRFSYRRVPPPPLPEVWVANWVFPDWPTAVRVEMAPLDHDPSRVPLVGATVPLRVNRQANVQYSDE
jgi:general secretion pathway protein J